MIALSELTRISRAFECTVMAGYGPTRTEGPAQAIELIGNQRTCRRNKTQARSFRMLSQSWYMLVRSKTALAHAGSSLMWENRTRH
jgi:hypothetical protein